MGQYYEIYCCKEGKEPCAYNRKVLPDCDYMPAKLTEHSWWENEFCRALAWSLVNSPSQVAWVGDYFNPTVEIQNYEFFINAIEATQGDSAILQPIEPAPSEFSLEDYVLVNNTKKSFLRLDKYKNFSTDNDGWCVFPISILTACGNGKGGGDYFGINLSQVGTWAGDTILLIEKEKITDKEYKDFNEYFVSFTEEI